VNTSEPDNPLQRHYLMPRHQKSRGKVCQHEAAANDS